MSGRESTPSVSVLMPVYNAARYLAASVESVLGQTFGDFELIAADDGSVDGSAEILEGFARSDARVRVFALPHRGQSATRNFTVRRARGEFLAEHDSDDLAMPRRLEVQVGYLRGHPECVAVGGRGEQIDPDGDPIAAIPVRLGHDAIERELLSGRGSAIIHSAAAYRREAVLGVGGYDERLALSEDLDLFLKLAERGRLANVPELVVRQRRHPGSVTAVCDPGSARRARERVVRDAYRRRRWGDEALNVREFYSPRSGPEVYLTWAAQALRAGHLRTAAKYGLRLAREGRGDPRPWWRFAWHGVAASGARSVGRLLRRSAGVGRGLTRQAPP